MLFFSFFKTLVGHEVTVELKNDISIRGTLKSVDQYLNIKLDDVSVVEEIKYPHLVSDPLICPSVVMLATSMSDHHALSTVFTEDASVPYPCADTSSHKA